MLATAERGCASSALRVGDFSNFLSQPTQSVPRRKRNEGPTSAADWECSRTATLVESGCGVIARRSWWRKRKGGQAVGEKFMGGGLSLSGGEG